MTVLSISLGGVAFLVKTLPGTNEVNGLRTYAEIVSGHCVEFSWKSVLLSVSIGHLKISAEVMTEERDENRTHPLKRMCNKSTSKP